MPPCHTTRGAIGAPRVGREGLEPSTLGLRVRHLQVFFRSVSGLEVLLDHLESPQIWAVRDMSRDTGFPRGSLAGQTCSRV